ncbi:MAG: nitrous oxide reductase accessory protein NosL, partial [Halobacteriales archaeon]|nr:nitrous oxide reductase accessory protein NosL [Halobacteriales archaeon]
MRLSAAIVVGFTVMLLLSSVAFAVPPGEGTHRSPVPFDRTVRLGMTTAGTAEAGAAGYVIPRAEVFFSQYRYVVGYEGITTLVDELNRAGTARQFGRPLVVYVTDFSGTDPSLTERGYLTMDPGGMDRWTPARDAHFLVGSRARTPGGPAVLPFSRRADATAVAQRIGGRVVDWETLRSRSFGTGA